MSLRAVPFANETPRISVRVARVAEILDCDESQVRRLIRKGEIEAHRQGIRGVRVFLDSIDAYRRRQTIKPDKGSTAKKPTPERSTASRAAHKAALAELRALGLL